MDGLISDLHLLRLAKRVLTPAIYFLENRNAKNLSLTLALLTKMVEEFDARNIPHAAIIIPARHQVRPRVHIGSYILDLVGLQSVITRQNTKFIEYFQRARVSYADTLEALKKRASAEPVMFSDDNHPNSNGHRIIARLVSHRIGPQISRIAARTCQAPRKAGLSTSK